MTQPAFSQEPEDCQDGVQGDGEMDRHGEHVEFSFILHNLATREQNALTTVGVTTTDDFCEYDFSKLHSVRGYGATTVSRLQALQKRVVAVTHPSRQIESDRLTLQSPVNHMRLATKECKALQVLEVKTVEEFINADLTLLVSQKGFGERTFLRLQRRKDRLMQDLSIALPKQVEVSGEATKPPSYKSYSAPTIHTPLDKSTPKTFLISLLKNYVQLERDIDVLVQRINGRTLDEIAKSCGVTRERIRQIEIKCKKRFSPTAASELFTEVRQMLESSIVKLRGFASLRDVAVQFAIDNDWQNEGCPQALVKFLLAKMDWDNRIICHDNGCYSTLSYPCNKCERLLSIVSNLYSELRDQHWTHTRLYFNSVPTFSMKIEKYIAN